MEKDALEFIRLESALLCFYGSAKNILQKYNLTFGLCEED